MAVDKESFLKEREGLKEDGIVYKFVTQIFFLTMECFHMSLIKMIQEYSRISREFVEIEQEKKNIEEGRSMWQNLPVAASYQRVLDKIDQRMKELVDMRIVFDMHLQDENFKKSTGYFVNFLLNLHW